MNSRYWMLDLDETTLGDLGENIALGPARTTLVGIVDEKAGGIIAYALSPAHAQRILAGLRARITRNDHDSTEK